MGAWADQMLIADCCTPPTLMPLIQRHLLMQRYFLEYLLPPVMLLCLASHQWEPVTFTPHCKAEEAQPPDALVGIRNVRTICRAFGAGFRACLKQRQEILRSLTFIVGIGTLPNAQAGSFHQLEPSALVMTIPV